MKEERNLNIDINNPTVIREYIAYLERKDERKRRDRRNFFSNVGTAFLCAITGAAIASIVILTVIGFATLF